VIVAHAACFDLVILEGPQCPATSFSPFCIISPALRIKDLCVTGQLDVGGARFAFPGQLPILPRDHGPRDCGEDVDSLLILTKIR
jgi:hypothetical protein